MPDVIQNLVIYITHNWSVTYISTINHGSGERVENKTYVKQKNETKVYRKTQKLKQK